MLAVATDVVWSVVSELVMSLSPAKMAKLVEVPFCMWTLIYVLDGVQIPHRKSIWTISCLVCSERDTVSNNLNSL